MLYNICRPLVFFIIEILTKVKLVSRNFYSTHNMQQSCRQRGYWGYFSTPGIWEFCYPIPTRGGTLCPSHYYQHPRIPKPNDSSVQCLLVNNWFIGICVQRVGSWHIGFLTIENQQKTSISKYYKELKTSTFFTFRNKQALIEMKLGLDYSPIGGHP